MVARDRRVAHDALEAEHAVSLALATPTMLTSSRVERFGSVLAGVAIGVLCLLHWGLRKTRLFARVTGLLSWWEIGLMRCVRGRRWTGRHEGVDVLTLLAPGYCAAYRARGLGSHQLPLALSGPRLLCLALYFPFHSASFNTDFGALLSCGSLHLDGSAIGEL